MYVDPVSDARIASHLRKAYVTETAFLLAIVSVVKGGWLLTL